MKGSVLTIDTHGSSGAGCTAPAPSRLEVAPLTRRRAERERPFLLLVVGDPAADAAVPHIRRQPWEGIAVFFEAASPTPTSA